MFCQNCGEKINDDVNFCDKCGNKIIGRSDEKKPNHTKRKFNANREYIFWLAIGAIVIFFIFYFVLGDPFSALFFAIPLSLVLALIVTLLKKEYKDPKAYLRMKVSRSPEELKKRKKGLMWAGYILAGILFATMDKKGFNSLAILIGSVVAGVLYYSLCVKYHYRYNVEVWLFFVFLAVGSMIIGFLTPIFNLFIQ